MNVKVRQTSRGAGTPHRHRHCGALCGAFGGAQDALAQDDPTTIGAGQRPFIMLLVDSSGAWSTALKGRPPTRAISANPMAPVVKRPVAPPTHPLPQDTDPRSIRGAMSRTLPLRPIKTSGSHPTQIAPIMLTASKALSSSGPVICGASLVTTMRAPHGTPRCSETQETGRIATAPRWSFALMRCARPSMAAAPQRSTTTLVEACVCKMTTSHVTSRSRRSSLET